MYTPAPGMSESEVETCPKVCAFLYWSVVFDSMDMCCRVKLKWECLKGRGGHAFT